MPRRSGKPPSRRGVRILAVASGVLVLVGATWIGIDLLRSDPAATTVPDESAVTGDAPPHAPKQGVTTSPPAREPRADDVDAPAPPAPLAGVVVGIDAGHNGGNAAHAMEINTLVDAGTLRKPCDTTGTQTPDGYTEALYNLDVARRLGRLLEQAGARLVMVRTSNEGWGPCIDERARITNTSDVAVSVHADGNLASGARGFHVIVPKRVTGLTDDIAAPSEQLGRSIRDALLAGTTLPTSTYVGREGIDVRDDLGGLNLSDVPKVLVETGNMKSRADRTQLESPAGRQRIAQAIARGIEAWQAARASTQ